MLDIDVHGQDEFIYQNFKSICQKITEKGTQNSI